MPKIPIIKSKDMLQYLLKYGCELTGISGSHHRLHNPANNRFTVLAMHSNKDFSKGAFSSILKQLGIDINEFIDFMDK